MSLSEVRNPHVKNNVVTIAKALSVAVAAAGRRGDLCGTTDVGNGHCFLAFSRIPDIECGRPPGF